ncbi:Rec8 like protein-domain-containing protein [Chytridium lagenaria]|nr:Rec8 like protein-domain-containing protein [Chytridium lagenaria]
MFYSDALLSRNETSSMAVVWISSTLGGSRSSIKKLSKKQLNGVNVSKACRYIVSPPEPMALRLSSNLMVGVSRVLGNQYSFLYTDANQVFLRLKKAFSELPQQGGSVLMDSFEAPYNAITLTADDEIEVPFEEDLNTFLQGSSKVAALGWVVQNSGQSGQASRISSDSLSKYHPRLPLKSFLKTKTA